MDLIVERDDGRVVAIETKVATTVSRWHRVSMWPAGGLGDQPGPHTDMAVKNATATAMMGTRIVRSLLMIRSACASIRFSTF